MEELKLKKEKLCEVVVNDFIAINHKGEFVGPLMALVVLGKHVKNKVGLDSEIKAVDSTKGTLTFKLSTNWTVELSNKLIKIVHYTWVIE